MGKKELDDIKKRGGSEGILLHLEIIINRLMKMVRSWTSDKESPLKK